MRINKNKLQELFLTTWFQILITPIWAVILFSGGLLDIEPLWFRCLLAPTLGVPAGIFILIDAQVHKKVIQVFDFCVGVLVVGLFYGLFGGILLALLISFLLKAIGIDLGNY